VLCRGSSHAALAAVIALAALPAGARGAVVTFGSDLSKPANTSETHGADTAFWNTSGPAIGTVPADGQITELRLKGIAVPSGQHGAPPPLTEFHFQVLRPIGGGAVRVTLSTNPMQIPAGGDPNRISTYRPDGYLCAEKGDYVDFNDEGGFVPTFYPRGVPYQVFSSVPSAATTWFSKDKGTNIGAEFVGQPQHGEELLLQAVLATGVDASPVCGGKKGKVFKGLQFRYRSVNVRRGDAPIRVTCPGVAHGSCHGTLELLAKGKVVGSTGFTVKPTTTVNLHVKLSRHGRRLLRRSRKLGVTAAADTRDESNARVQTRAPLVLNR
jgi:hypothetical protein